MLNRTLPRIRPHELIIIASTIALMLVIRYHLNRELEPYWGFDVVTAFLEVIVMLSVIAIALQTLLKRDRANMRKYIRYQRRLASILDLLRHMLIIGLTIYVYTWLKIFIPLLNVKLYDQQLYNIDNLIHLGVNPNRFLIALFPYRWFLHFLDFEYKQYHMSVLCGV